MNRVDQYLYPKLVAWEYHRSKVVYGLIPANSRHKISRLMQFLDDNSDFYLNLDEIELVDSIFPIDQVYMLDKNGHSVLILDVQELESIYQELNGEIN